MNTYKMELTFEAEDQQDADRLAEEICLIACQGEGEGEDHVCKNSFVATGPQLVPDEV